VLTLIQYKKKKKRATNYTRSFGRDELLGSFSLTSRPKAIQPCQRVNKKWRFFFFSSLLTIHSTCMLQEKCARAILQYISNLDGCFETQNSTAAAAAANSQCARGPIFFLHIRLAPVTI
jgi:hypothetical protein